MKNNPLTLTSPTGERTIVLMGSACFTLADALAMLDEAIYGPKHTRREEGPVAIISSMPICLPSGTLTAVAGVTAARARVRVGLPFSEAFIARDATGATIQRDIALLDGTNVYQNGMAELVDGTRLRAIEFIRTKYARALSKQQKDILRLAISSVGAEDLCYRQMDGDVLPGVYALDFAAVRRLGDQVRLFKVIVSDVQERMPGVSRETIAKALRDAGMRPRLGSRAHRPSSASIAPQLV